MKKKLNCSLWKLVFSGNTNATYYASDNHMSVWFDNKAQVCMLTFHGSTEVALDGFTPINPGKVNMSLSGTSYSIVQRAHR